MKYSYRFSSLCRRNYSTHGWLPTDINTTTTTNGFSSLAIANAASSLELEERTERSPGVSTESLVNIDRGNDLDDHSSAHESDDAAVVDVMGNPATAGQQHLLRQTARAHYYLGLAHFHLGEYDLANDALIKARAADPISVSVRAQDQASCSSSCVLMSMPMVHVYQSFICSRYAVRDLMCLVRFT